MASRAEVIDRQEPDEAMALDSETLDPGKHYRFCHPRNMARRKSQGYEVVLRSESGVRLRSDDDSVKTADDLIHFGNLILMSCDKKYFYARRQRVAKLAHDRLSSSEKQFEARAKKRGVRSLTDDEGE